MEQIYKKNSLQEEKTDFLKATCNFLDTLEFEEEQVNGRPKADQREILKHLLVMSYNATSYRRSLSDIKILCDQGFVKKIIPRSTLNDYANDSKIIILLERLIQISATFFKEIEDTLIVDSSWFGEKMYVGGCGQVHANKQGLFNTRKIHVGILKISGVICYAKATHGTRHDCPIFKDILIESSNIFNLKYCLGDKGYCSKENYILCEEKNITAFLDFKKNMKSSGGKSAMWKDQIDVWRNNSELWHKSYNYRVLVESVFSRIKKKHNNYLRSRKADSRDIEMLLKCLVYNLTLIGKSFKSDSSRT
ncbi:transposase [Candidatus Pacearchaeota archaeon]|nr:transposase [Candidatus Pacearchaeota archaeon]